MSTEEKQRLESILRKLHEDVSSSESDGDENDCLSKLTPSETQKLQDVDYDSLISDCVHRCLVKYCEDEGDVDVSKLIPAELVDAFHHQLNIGFQSDVVPAFVPWWEREDVQNFRLNEDGMSLIQPVEKEHELTAGGMPMLPKEPIPKLRTLIKGRVSSTVKWQLLQVL